MLMHYGRLASDSDGDRTVRNFQVEVRMKIYAKLKKYLYRFGIHPSANFALKSLVRAIT